MKVYLKVKIKSLAAEARIIRREELRFPRGRRYHEAYLGLHHHRTVAVRSEARAALLAYGFIRGRAYATIEAKCYDEPDWTKVTRLVSSYGSARVEFDEIRAWAKGKPYVRPAMPQKAA